MSLKTIKPLRTIVTDLQMNSPPTRLYSRPSNIQTALMRTDNIPLHFYRYLQYRVGNLWHWVSRHRLTDDELAKIVHNETTDIDVLYIDGAPSGFYEIDRSCANQVNLAYFGMMEHVTGRGLGKWFLTQAINAAWENEPECITVNTCTLDHPAALTLYQKLGFQAIARSEASFIPLTDEEKCQTLK